MAVVTMTNDAQTLMRLVHVYRAQAESKVLEGQSITVAGEKGYKDLSKRRMIEAELLNVLAEQLVDMANEAQAEEQERTPRLATPRDGFLVHRVNGAGVALCGLKRVQQAWLDATENGHLCERCHVQGEQLT